MLAMLTEHFLKAAAECTVHILHTSRYKAYASKYAPGCFHPSLQLLP